MKSRRYISLEVEERHLYGFVLGVSKSLVLLHQFYDFSPNGYVVSRLDYIDEVVSNRNTAFFEKMMSGEGLLDRVGISFELPLHSVADLLREVRARGYFVLLDRGPDDDPDEDVSVGELTAIDDLRVRVQQISANGKWTGERVLETARIRLIRFDSPYLNAFKKYAPPR